jgi:hypothetical protein
MHLPRFARLIACALALALWFASTLGLVHGVVHVPGLPHVPAAAALGQAPVAKSLIASLFADHHDGDAQCRLYDQLSHGPSAITVPLIVLPLVLPTAIFDYFQGEALARWVALFRARGPPSTR